ncbi:MAG: HRDC domain-containing protein [Actinomycetota bacterium]|nr:HRDC domain-containing protein [Actinomycetota bacterium]
MGRITGVVVATDTTETTEGAGEGWRFVTDAGALREVVDRLIAADRYALDTEFHRERTYWPKVALVQVAWPAGPTGAAGVALIDPQAVDLAPLEQVLAGPGQLVAHAADQDLEVLELACGCGPSRLWDTQVAAGFVGHGTASLATLSLAFLGRAVAKGDRLTDWSRRPLTDSQLSYAAADVQYLLDLADAIGVELDRNGRRSWAEDECELLRSRPHGPGDPNRAWWKLRDARQLRGPSRGVAQEVAAWRELRAQRLDQPVRLVLPDLALQAITHNPPSTPAALASIRGLESRYLRTGVADEILAAVKRGRQLPAEAVCPPPADEVSRELRPAVTLAMAWVGQLAREQKVDVATLATRVDLVAYLRDDPDARLGRGWRAAMVGAPLRELVEGRAALAFDGQGGLALEARSGQPLAISS